MKVRINFEREFPRPTFLGCCVATLAIFLGFLARTFYDYIDSKNQFLRNIKSISSNLGQDPQGLLNVVDAISYVNQVGRLDIISLVLALLGIILGFGAVAGFMHIKDTAENIAGKATKKWLSGDDGKREVETSFNNWVKENNQIFSDMVLNATKETMKRMNDDVGETKETTEELYKKQSHSAKNYLTNEQLENLSKVAEAFIEEIDDKDK